MSFNTYQSTMRLLTCCFICCLAWAATAQQAKIAAVGFYNIENLYDTLDAPDVQDEEFLPNSSKGYSTFAYQTKLNHIAGVIADLGKEVTPDGLAILGLSEVENRQVIQDLVSQPSLASRKYEIAHFDSPDVRGVDVALIYQPKYFTMLQSQPINVDLIPFGGDRPTRDILWVTGLLDGDTLHILVNHWPSRRGGEESTRPLRNAAAAKCKALSDSLTMVNPMAKIIIMGDLNDDPNNDSVAKVIGAKPKAEQVKAQGFFNPMWSLYKKGVGSLAYGDAWNLFDQTMISYGLLNDQKGYHYYKVNIYNKPYLLQKEGNFKGYPYRFWIGDSYAGGYSDHLPVYVFLVKNI